MFRTLTIAAMVALMLPAIAVAQDYHDNHKGPPPGHPGGPPHPPPHPGGPPPQHPQFRAVPQHGPMAAPMAGPMHPGPAVVVGHPGAQFSYHGHPYNRVYAPHPFVYPPGWAYRRWAVGAILPPLFLVPQYYYTDWAALGFEPPPPGFQWVRYGPDLLLVNVATGAVAEVIPDVFY